MAEEKPKSPAENEFDATRAMYAALQPLDEDARTRVVNHVAAMLGITAPKQTKREAPTEEDDIDDVAVAASAAEVKAFKTFADLFDAADPQTTAHRALVAGYWIQVCEGAETFDGQRANKELNHLGHKVPNITNAVDALKAQKPALVIQTKKAGTSQQARKTYKVTTAGVAAVKAMLNG
jgi:hypothetical protein